MQAIRIFWRLRDEESGKHAFFIELPDGSSAWARNRSNTMAHCMIWPTAAIIDATNLNLSRGEG